MVLLFWILALLLPVDGWAFTMGGPAPMGAPAFPSEAIETSPLKIGMQGLVRLYQKGISPVNPDRCGFRPSCSAYGSLAVREHGPLWGVIMTADRLMRCHYLKKPGPGTTVLPDGKLLDLPPPKSLPDLSEP